MFKHNTKPKQSNFIVNHLTSPFQMTGKRTVKVAGDLPDPDFVVLTSGGLRIPVHSHILAMVSPVMEKIMEKPDRARKTGEKVIPIVGVPCDSVSSFVRFIYSSSCTSEEMEKYGIHLLALSHVFSVSKLKHRCTKELAEKLTLANVVDVLQLSRLCDAPDLYLKSMRVVASNFNAVEKTEGWKFLQKHDPWLELEILQFMEDMELRQKRSKKHKEEQSLYLQLSEAMECLVHICTEGCTCVGPYDMEPSKKEPCTRFATCRGLQLLIKHFATCKKRVNDGCSRCKRMWQLLKLHASLCDQPDLCRVPLCRVVMWELNTDLVRLAQESNEAKQAEFKDKKIVTKILPAKRFYRAKEWSETVFCQGLQRSHQMLRLILDMFSLALKSLLLSENQCSCLELHKLLIVMLLVAVASWLFK